MFSGEVISVAFITMLIVAVPLEWLEKRELFGPAKALLAVGVIAGLYCILAGIHMAGGLEDPFATADREALGSASPGRGRIGFILAIRFWPYILMGAGAFAVYKLGIGLWNRRRQ